MTRGDGFDIADTSTALPMDPKFKALLRRLRDPAAMCHARTLYEDVRLASWLVGERVTVEDGASYWLDPDPEITFAMVAVGLLDEEHRIPEKAWASWYGAAFARREDTRLRGQIGGLMTSLGMSREDARAEAIRRRSPKPGLGPAHAEPNPTVPPSGRPADPPAGPAVEVDHGASAGEARPPGRNGLEEPHRPPPPPVPDGVRRQVDAAWRTKHNAAITVGRWDLLAALAVDAPTGLLLEWIRDAPRDQDMAIDYITDRWKAYRAEPAFLDDGSSGRSRQEGDEWLNR